MDVDYIKSFFGVFEFRVIHGFYGLGHLFYTDAFIVLVGLPVPLICSRFVMEIFLAGYACARVNDGYMGGSCVGGS